MVARHLAFYVLLVASIAGPAAAAPSTKQVQKTLKTLIAALRYGKYDLAAKQLDVDRMVERLLAGHQVTEAERKELVSGFDTILRQTSFVKGNEMFEHLDAVLYDKARHQDGATRCKSTIVVHRNYKKTEIVIDWVLAEKDGAVRVYDLVMLGESTLEGIREDQVEPLIREGGTAALLTALRDKLKELETK